MAIRGCRSYGFAGSDQRAAVTAVQKSLAKCRLFSRLEASTLFCPGMSYLDEHLLDGERIVYRARLHWTIFIVPIVLLLLGAAMAIILGVYQPEYWYIGAALAGIGLLLAISPAINYTSS